MNRKLIILLYSAVLLMVPFSAFAIAPVQTIIDNVMDMILWPIFVGVMTIMTLWAGYLFFSANGDPSKVALAKKTFILVIVGTLIGVGAWGIIGIIEGVFGV